MMPEMFRFHHKMKFHNDDLEDCDNFDVYAAVGALNGRSNDRFKKTGSRRRQKSPCYQLGPPRRQLWRDFPDEHGRNSPQAPSIPKAPSVTSIESIQTINTSVGGSVISITGSMSSSGGSSSSGARILPSEPSMSSSRNTMYGIQSPWTSTSSLRNTKKNYYFKFY